MIKMQGNETETGMQFSIKCARCDRMVDGWSFDISPDGETMTITARCHGATDVMAWHMQDFRNSREVHDGFVRAVNGTIEGTAFTHNQFAKEFGPETRALARLRSALPQPGEDFDQYVSRAYGSHPDEDGKRR